MRKKKIKIIISRWLLTVINLAGIIIIAGYVYTGAFNIKAFGFGYSTIIAYGIISILLIRVYFARKLRSMYLYCSIEEIDEMTGIEFEVYLYHKFKKLGYKAKMTPVTGDYGADLVLKKRREKTVVQAKRYRRDVGIAAVQEVIGSIAYYNADSGMVITNSYFTPNADNLAAANEITLWDRSALITYLIKEEETGDSLEEYPDRAPVRYCPVCGKKLIRRTGRYGYFLGCCGYPECSYTKPLPDTER